MSTWMNGKSLMKQNHLGIKNFIANYIWKTLQMEISRMRKEFVKTLK